MVFLGKCNAETSLPADRFECEWPLCSPVVFKAKVTFCKQWKDKLHERIVKDDNIGLVFLCFFSVLLKICIQKLAMCQAYFECHRL